MVCLRTYKYRMNIQVCNVLVPVCTWYVHVHTYFYLISSVNTEPCFTVLCDANMLVPDVQQPPAEQDIDRGDNEGQESEGD
jgi:hypothetical protein